MATRSVIGIADRNGDGQLIFCFFNGSPNSNGLVLPPALAGRIQGTRAHGAGRVVHSGT